MRKTDILPDYVIESDEINEENVLVTKKSTYDTQTLCLFVGIFVGFVIGLWIGKIIYGF